MQGGRTRVLFPRLEEDVEEDFNLDLVVVPHLDDNLELLVEVRWRVMGDGCFDPQVPRLHAAHPAFVSPPTECMR